MADGRINKCKQCCRQAAKNNRVARLDYYRQYDRERLATDNRKQQRSERQKAYMARNQNKHEARMAVFRAIRSGAMSKQPCEVCAQTPAEAHHDDYDKPLAVRWLCRTHHLIEHGKYTQRSHDCEVLS